MNNLKLIWHTLISDHYSLYSTMLNGFIIGTFSTLTVMELLRDANKVINEFGYSIALMCLVSTLILKAIELRYKIKKVKNGSNNR